MEIKLAAKYYRSLVLEKYGNCGEIMDNLKILKVNDVEQIY